MATLNDAAREIDIMAGAADRLLSLWNRLPESKDRELYAAYPAEFPCLEEVISALLTWRDSLGNTAGE